MTSDYGGEPRFQTQGTGDYPKIATREAVHRVLGLYSDHLNWNVEPGIETELRRVLCRIYGHSPYSGYTWKPLGYCYWCFEKVLTDAEIQHQLEALPVWFRDWHRESAL